MWKGVLGSFISHINELKIICTVYKLLEPLFLLSYDFGMISPGLIMKYVHLMFFRLYTDIYNKFSFNLAICFSHDMSTMHRKKNQSDNNLQEDEI